MKVVTPEQMQRIDRVTIEEQGVPGVQLMEKAGRRVADLVLERFSPSKRVGIVAGRGNNAGDGFVAARYLAEAGKEVYLLMLFSPDELRGDALINFRHLPEKVRQVGAGSTREVRGELKEAEIIIDAILGTGVSGPVSGELAGAIEAINESGKPVVAVDVPSGLVVDGSLFEGLCVRATITVTMGLPKLGMVIYPGVEYCGELVVAELDFSRDLLKDPRIKHNLVTEEMVRSLLPERPQNSNKKTFGFLLIVGGSRGMSGAVVLAARASTRTGTGLTYVAFPEALAVAMESLLIDPVKIPLPGAEGWFLDKKALPVLGQWMERMDAVVLGPGIGTEPATGGVVEELIRQVQVPLVIDADGLNLLVRKLEILKERKGLTVLTPHPGEMARLCETTPAEVQRDRLGYARRLAEEYRVVVALKGARTVIGTPEGEVFINPTGNSALAKGGSGDVLTGMIGSFLAQGCRPLPATLLGVYLHGLTGELAAEERTEYGVTPGDLVEYIPRAFASLQ